VCLFPVAYQEVLCLSGTVAV